MLSNQTPVTTNDSTPANRIGRYVTAFASDIGPLDLGPSLVGQVLVMSGRSEWWDAAQVEVVVDATGSYCIRPNPWARVGSAGSYDHVTLGRLGSDLVLDEITWWELDDVLRMEPEAFAAEVRDALWAEDDVR